MVHCKWAESCVLRTNNCIKCLITVCGEGQFPEKRYTIFTYKALVVQEIVWSIISPISPVRKTKITGHSSNRKGFNSRKWLQGVGRASGERGRKKGTLPRDEKLLPPLSGWGPSCIWSWRLRCGQCRNWTLTEGASCPQCPLNHPYHWCQTKMASSLLPPVTPIVQTWLEASW